MACHHLRPARGGGIATIALTAVGQLILPYEHIPPPCRTQHALGGAFNGEVVWESIDNCAGQLKDFRPSISKEKE